jgi:hypothetical protein
MAEKIQIKHFDLEFERNMQTTESYVELHDTYFKYVSKYDSEIPKDQNDLLQGWEEKFYDFDLRIKREYFVSVEKYWNDKNENWRIELEITGYPGTVNLYYQKKCEKEMDETFNKLFNWVFNIK